MFKFKLTISFFLLLYFDTLPAQQSLFAFDYARESYKNIEQEQEGYLYELYFSRIDPSFELINGRGYFPYYFRSEKKPMLFLDKNHTSSLTLNGRKFENIRLDYDSFTDEVIYTDTTRVCVFYPLKVALNRENVDQVEFYDGIDSLIFRYYSKDNDPSFNINDGYYEVLSESKIRYIIKHSSILVRNQGIDEYYYSRTGYIDSGNGFSKITTKKKFTSLFGSRKDEVRKFIVSSGIKIRQANKQQIMSILIFYEKLISKNN